MGTFQNQVDGEGWRSIQFQVSQSWSRFLLKQEASFYNFSVGNDLLYNQGKIRILLSLKDWWYNREDTQSPTFSSEAIPPPPPLASDVPRDMCPVCRRARGQGDTLAPVSGLVFCYPCIVTSVRWEQFRQAVHCSEINDSICFYRKDGKCPVTGLPLIEEDLIRLFWPEK